MNEPSVFSVSDVNEIIKQTLQEHSLLSNISVVGEVFGYSQPDSGHKYFTLKDDHSQIRCVMWRSKYNETNSGGNFIIEGSKIICKGYCNIYEVNGQLQLYVSRVKAEGEGSLQAAFEELRARLEKEGLFDESRKRNIPEFPKKIVAITSSTGSVIQDMKNVLSRRYPIGELLLIPVSVQGENSVNDICDAFQITNNISNLDVIILARGGGSIEDLWSFNDERVAKAIYGSKHPVVSAIGHETDFTISDYVADYRAPTPSVAAEIVAPNMKNVINNINEKISTGESLLEKKLNEKFYRIDINLEKINNNYPNFLELRKNINNLISSVDFMLSNTIQSKKEKIKNIKNSISILNPKLTLKRGFALVRNKNGKIVDKTSAISLGERISFELSDGFAVTEVKEISKDDK
ncbi:MAG: exodeoxyribonuclease VII large subunit [Chloroflexi bacterium]|nr:exodeoxyribonuclease VII large subunit [Chloroflexota bacterium]